MTTRIIFIKNIKIFNSFILKWILNIFKIKFAYAVLFNTISWIVLLNFAQSSNAQVIIDPLAPIQFKPSITSSGSGVPVVDITAPSFGGISHNKFKSYNIDINGIILNNSKLNGTSIIGGQVKANSNLSNQQPAKVILNEVTSSSMSTLNGPTEVFGNKADVIIANPNGINCIGCTFINSNKVTLSTGIPSPDYNRGTVDFNVKQGSLFISGSGISAQNGNNLQDIDLIGRQINLNAPILSEGVVRLRAGGMIYQPSSDTISSLDPSLLPTITGFSIASTNLGVIKAGTLSIASRDINLGVSLKGDLLTTASSLTILSYGDINVSNLKSAGDIQFNADGNLTLSAQGIALGRISVNANTIQIDLNAEIFANDALVFSAIKSLTSRGILRAGTAISIISKGAASTSGLIESNGDVAIEAQNLFVSNSNIYGSAVILSGIQSAILSDSELLSTVGNVAISGQNIELGLNTKFQAKNILSIDAKSQLINSTILNHSNLYLNVKNKLINSVSGKIIQDNLSLLVVEQIVNSGLLYGLSSLNLKSNLLINNADGIIYGPLVTINMPSSISNQGQILADKNLLISTGDFKNSNLIQSNDLKIVSQSYNNDTLASKIIAANAQLIISGDLTNSGTIIGIDKLSASVDGQIVNDGNIKSSGDLSLTGKNYISNLDSALLFGNSTSLDITGDVSNHGDILASTELLLKSGGILTNSGNIASSHILTINTDGSFINSSLVSGQTSTITAASYQGVVNSILYAESLKLSVTGDVENAGQFNILSNLDLSSASLINQTNALIAADKLSISTKYNLVNSGIIQGKSAALLSISGDVTNSGQLLSMGDLSLQITGKILNSGSIQSIGSLTFKAADVTNFSSGQIQALAIDGTITNDLNNSGLITADQLLSLKVSNIVNSGSSASIATLIGENLSLTVSGSINNAANALLRATESAAITAASVNSNFLINTTTSQGLLAFNKTLQLTLLQSGMTFASDFTSTGNLLLTVSGDIINQSTLGVGGVLALKSTQGSIINNENAIIYSGSDMSLDAFTNITNTSGILQSLGSLTVTAGGEFRNERKSNIWLNIYNDYDVNYKFANCCWHERHLVETEGSSEAVTSVQGNMHVKAQSFVNLASLMSVGGDFIVDSISFDNAQRALTETIQGFRDSCSGCTKGLRYTNYQTNYTPSEIDVAGHFFTSNTQSFNNGGTINALTATVKSPSIVVGITGVTIPAAPARLPDPVIDLSKVSSVITNKLKPSTAPSFQPSPTGSQTVTFLHSSPIATNPSDRNPTWILGQLNITGPSLTFFADPLTEQRLIQQSLLQQTGQAMLDPRYKSPKEQQEALYKATVDYMKANPTVSFGTELTATQRKAVTLPILWYVKRIIDGQEVLVPELVLPEADLEKYRKVAVGGINAENISLIGDQILNTGILSAVDTLAISADTFKTIKRVTTTSYGAAGFEAGAYLKAKSISIVTRGDMISLGGTMLAGNNLSIDAGGRLLVGSQTAVSDIYSGSKKNWTIVHDVKNLGSVLSSGGDLHLASGSELAIQGSSVTATGKVDLYGAQAVSISSVLDEHFVQSGGKKSGLIKSSSFNASDKTTTNIISVVAAGTDLTVQSGGNINIKASTLAATNALALQAGVGPQARADASVVISSGTDTHESTYSKKTSGIGVFTGGGSVDVYRSTRTAQNAFSTSTVASSLSAGGNLSVGARQDVSVIGSSVSATGLATLSAGRDLSLLPATDYTNTFASSTTKGIGLSFSSGSGGLSLSAGYHAVTDKSAGQATLTTPASIYGGQGVVLEAGRNAVIQAAEIFSPKAIAVKAGQDLTILPAIDTARSSQSHSAVMAGITLKVSQNITSALQQAQAVPSTFNSGHGGAGYEAIGRVSAILQGIDAVQSLTNPSVSASLTLGGSGSFSTAQAYSTSVKPSVLSAGTDITLVAGRDVHVQAAQIQAGGALSVTAGRDLTLESAQAVTQASQSSSSFSAGIGVGGSCSATQGCSGGVTGQAAGALSTAERQSVTQVNTQLKAGGALALKADNDTVIAGALVTGQTLRIDAGRDLLITSRQDTARSSNQSVNASASVTIGAGASGSVGVGGASGQSDKAWVTQQTQVVANDRLEVSTKGHTQLGGAVINSKTGNLSVETGTLGVTTIKDHDRGSQTGVQVSVSGSLQSGGSQGAQGSQGSQGSQSSSTPQSAAQTQTPQTQTPQTGAPQTGTQPSGAQPQSPQKQSTSASVSGTVQNYDRAQDTRGTIGAGSITIRDPSKSDITQLNRDVTQSQVITKDTSSGVKFYASSEAVKEVLSGGEQIRKNIAALATQALAGFPDISKTMIEGLSGLMDTVLPKNKYTEEELKQILVASAAVASNQVDPDNPYTCQEGFIQRGIFDWLITPARAATACVVNLKDGRTLPLPAREGVQGDCNKMAAAYLATAEGIAAAAKLFNYVATGQKLEDLKTASQTAFNKLSQEDQLLAAKYIPLTGEQIGSSQTCVQLVNTLFPGIGSVTGWKFGDNVLTNPPPMGTPISTKETWADGSEHYGPQSDELGKSGVTHVAIFIALTDAGMIVFHQYAGSKGGRFEVITKGQWSGSTKQAAEQYYVIKR